MNAKISIFTAAQVGKFSSEIKLRFKIFSCCFRRDKNTLFSVRKKRKKKEV